MVTRTEELKGEVGKGLGGLTVDSTMQREGQAEQDAARLEREAEGAIDKDVGEVEETVGDVTDDTEAQLKGKKRQVEGSIERAG